MKSLENRAEKYDKGIKKLTLGKYPEIQTHISNEYLKKGDYLLDLGMGTGTFAILAAQMGVKVVGIDSSQKMLGVAKDKISRERLTELIEVLQSPIVNLDKYFHEKMFDKVTAMLSFSELYGKEQEYCLDQVYRVLKDDGVFILLDEVRPKTLGRKILFYLIRFPIAVITYLKSHLLTKPMRNIRERVKNHHFTIIESKFFLWDSLGLFIMKKDLHNKLAGEKSYGD